MSISSIILTFILGAMVLLDYKNSLEENLLNTMDTVAADIVKYSFYTQPVDKLKETMLMSESNHEDSHLNHIINMEFSYKIQIDEELNELVTIKELPNKLFLVIESSSKYIDGQVLKLLYRLTIGFIIGMSIIIYLFHLLLVKLFNPLKCLVGYCNNKPTKTSIFPDCRGSYEINSLVEAIKTLQKNNQMLCKEKQDVFKEAAHELKTPIAILKARLSLFGKSDMLKDEFIKDSTSDISTISNKLRELIFLKAIEWDILQSKETVQMQMQCSMMQQLFKPILEKKNLIMISNLEEDFSLCIHREAMGKVMQAIFENIFMHTKNGTTINTYVDKEKHTLSIVNEISDFSDEILFSSHIGTKLIERLAEQLEYEYNTCEENNFFYTTIKFKNQEGGGCKISTNILKV